ncbi:MAG: hypothetical protein ACT6RZ_05330 [Methylophilus sp.]|uniref:hypothetical protein n=1 Tax=Methylophilus sp. TaxID=29541 RepID=UPI004035C612
MKYFIICVAVAGICISVLPGKQSADIHMQADDTLVGACMANLSAGAACPPSAQSQHKYVLVRGQLLPL